MAESLVEARGLTKRFGDFTAVDAIDFDIARGESFGFLGPNGAGKTSTMKMITTVSPITEGQDFDLVTLVTMPLFLFSGTFYPLDVYPPVIQQIAKISPLYHGTELLRGFTLGVVDWSMLGHTAFLLAMGMIGAATRHRLCRYPPSRWVSARRTERHTL